MTDINKSKGSKLSIYWVSWSYKKNLHLDFLFRRNSFYKSEHILYTVFLTDYCFLLSYSVELFPFIRFIWALMWNIWHVPNVLMKIITDTAFFQAVKYKTNKNRLVVMTEWTHENYFSFIVLWLLSVISLPGIAS